MFWMLPSSRAAGPAAGELVVGPLGRRAVRGRTQRSDCPAGRHRARPDRRATGRPAVQRPAALGRQIRFGRFVRIRRLGGRRLAHVGSPSRPGVARPGCRARIGRPLRCTRFALAGRAGLNDLGADRHGRRPAAGSLCALRHRPRLGVFQFGTGRTPPSFGPSAAGATASLVFQAGDSDSTRLVRAAPWPRATRPTRPRVRSRPTQFAHQRIAAAAPDSDGVAAAAEHGRRASAGARECPSVPAALCRSNCPPGVETPAWPVRRRAGGHRRSAFWNNVCRRNHELPQTNPALKIQLASACFDPPGRTDRARRTGAAQWSCTGRTVVTIGSDPAGLESCSGYRAVEPG